MPLLSPEECVAQFELPVAPCCQARPDPELAEPLEGEALERLYLPLVAPGFGDRLRRAREEACMPIGALAYETYIHATELLDFEREAREPTPGQFRRIASELGTTFEALACDPDLDDSPSP